MPKDLFLFHQSFCFCQLWFPPFLPFIQIQKDWNAYLNTSTDCFFPAVQRFFTVALNAEVWECRIGQLCGRHKQLRFIQCFPAAKDELGMVRLACETRTWFFCSDLWGKYVLLCQCFINHWMKEYSTSPYGFWGPLPVFLEIFCGQIQPGVN